MMSASKKYFEDIIANLSGVKVPSTLWAPHLHPEHKFISFILLDEDHTDPIKVNKSIVLKNTKISIDVDVFIYGIHIDSTFFIKKSIQGICEVSQLISKVHEAYVCIRHDQNKKCLKIVDKKNTLCSNCLNESICLVSKENDSKKAIIEEKTNEDNTGNFKCAHCAKSFPSRYVLNKHIRKHSTKFYKCTVCKKTFVHKTTYQVHFIRQHETITKIYLCSICGKGYRTVELLKSHELKHTNTQGNQNSLKFPYK